MDHNPNVQLFKAQMDAFGQRDVDQLLLSFAEAAVLQDMSAPDAPWSGKSEIREFLRDYFSHLTDVRVNIKSVATADDLVVAELEVEAGYAPNGSDDTDIYDVVMRYCVVEVFQGGKIVSERFYWDRAEFESQLTSS